MIKTVLKTLICEIILLADNNPTTKDKILYYLSIISTLAPIAYVFTNLSIWFESNKQFFSFIVINILINMFVGIWFHRKFNTFRWDDFLAKNSYMITIIFVSYVTLEMLRVSAGNNTITEAFKYVIQVSTLLYPSSKILKNIYVLSNRKAPPEFIMKRLYKFEQTGILDDIFKKMDEEEAKNIKIDENK